MGLGDLETLLTIKLTCQTVTTKLLEKNVNDSSSSWHKVCDQLYVLQQQQFVQLDSQPEHVCVDKEKKSTTHTSSCINSISKEETVAPTSLADM